MTYIPSMITSDTVRAMLRHQAVKLGSLRKVANDAGCTVAYLSDILRGRREPGPTVLTYLGLERIDVPVERRYRRVEKCWTR